MWAKLGKLFKNNTFNLFLIIGITVLVLWGTLKDDTSAKLSMLAHADWRWVLVIVLIMILTQVILGWALAKTCQLTNPKYTWGQGIVNAFVASFFNGITPSASGGQFAQVYIFRKQGIPVSNSAGVLWMDFIVYQTTMVLSVFILILLRFHVFYAKYSQFFIIVLFGFAVNAAVIGGLWALVSFPKFYTWLTTQGLEIGCKMHLIKDREKALKSINEQLERFGGEVKVLKTHRRLIMQISLADFTRLLLYYSVPFFCSLALHIPVSPSLLLDVIVLSSFVSMVNAFIPLPGSSGGTEASFVLMFSTIFGQISASSIMIMWRFMTYYLMLVLGGMVFLYAKSRPDVEIPAATGTAQPAEELLEKEERL